MRTSLDHIVIGAANLEQGVAGIKQMLGVDIPAGGEHPRMGTHNHLMRLGGDVFLEIISINPNAPPPSRPRWYALDDPFVKAGLEQHPRLLTWVINTSDIASVVKQSPVPIGVPEPVHRDDLKWLFAIPEDGHLPGAGFIPSVIQWQTKTHPARRMADLGCSLLGLEIHHPQAEWLKTTLKAINAEQHVELHSIPANTFPYLAARIQTPSGTKRLTSRPGI